MVATKMAFETLDAPTKAEARRFAVQFRNEGVRHDADRGRFVEVMTHFLEVMQDSDVVAFGSSEQVLSPEEAGQLLGISRPLVVRRMKDGRLKHHMVGGHRKCLLKDVMALKEEESRANEDLALMYDMHDEIENAPSP